MTQVQNGFSVFLATLLYSLLRGFDCKLLAVIPAFKFGLIRKLQRNCLHWAPMPISSTYIGPFGALGKGYQKNSVAPAPAMSASSSGPVASAVAGRGFSQRVHVPNR